MTYWSGTRRSTVWNASSVRAWCDAKCGWTRISSATSRISDPAGLLMMYRVRALNAWLLFLGFLVVILAFVLDGTLIIVDVGTTIVVAALALIYNRSSSRLGKAWRSRTDA